jgi:2-methylcitrate synthase
MGFGHRVYREIDPRSPVGFELANELKELETSDPKLFDIAKAIRDKVKAEKGLPDNIDFFGGLIYHYMEIERLYYTPLFIMSRAAGWAAHAFEQRANNRIIRPSSEYIGVEPREFVALEDRK